MPYPKGKFKDKQCELCHTTYTPTAIAQRYCTSECSRKGHTIKYRRRAPWKPPERQCVVCGAAFNANGSPTLMCSDKCRKVRRNIAKHKRNGTVRSIHRKCVTCGKGGVIVRHCSKACRVKSSTVNQYAMRRDAPGKINYMQWGQMLVAFGGRCAYCGSDGKIHMDHMTPVSRGGHHNIDNLQPLCAACNIRKHDMTDAEYRAKYPHLITRNEPKSTLEAWQKAEKVKSA